MPFKNDLKLMASAATLALIAVFPAYAEELSNDIGNDEIIVTAQKREQSIQDVAAAVSTLSGDDFDTLNISNPSDLSEKIPGLVATNVQGYRRTFAIRGIGNEVPDNAATKPAVAYHVDGVFMSNDFALFQDLVDIDRIEVTRGPDGTIYGNSSTGGAVNVITRKPNLDTVEGSMGAEFGSYNTANIRGSLNIPLGSTVAARLSASQRSHDGFTKNIPNPNASPLNVLGAFNDLDDENNISLNAQLLWQPAENFSARATFQHFNMDNNGPALKGGFDTVSPDPRVVSHDTTEFFRVKNSIGSLIVDWSTPIADIKGLFSIQKYKMSRALDADRSSLTANDPAPLAIPSGGTVTLLGQLPIRQHVGGLTQEDSTRTAEINLVSPSSSGLPFNWQLGGFWMDTDIESNTRNFVDNGRDGRPVNTTLIGLTNPDTDFQNSDTRSFSTLAFFGQISVPITDRLNVTGGARWTRNKFADVRCNIFSRCLTSEGRVGTPTRPSEENDNVTYKFSADYAISKNNMIYASIATGVKPAASNNGFVSDPNGVGFFPEIYDEEKLTSYEFGSKNTFFDKKVQLNASFYYYDIKNYLFNSAGLSLTGNGVSGGSNLPQSKVYGLELESVFALRDNLKLHLTMTAADSKITKGRLAIDRAEQVNQTAGLTDPAATTAKIRSLAQDLTGNKLAKIPELVVNARLTHDQKVQLPFASGTLTSTVSYQHRGEYFNRVYNSARDIVPSHDLAHLSFRFKPDNSAWAFEFAVQNLFDTDAVSSVHTDDFFQGVTSVQLLAPRVTTLRAEYRF